MKRMCLANLRMHKCETNVPSTNFKAYNENKNSSLLAPISYAVLKNLSTVVFAGTKLSVSNAITNASDTLQQQETYPSFVPKCCSNTTELVQYLKQYILLDDDCKKTIANRAYELQGCRIRFAAELMTLIAQFRKEHTDVQNYKIIKMALDCQIEALKIGISNTLMSEWKKRSEFNDDLWYHGLYAYLTSYILELKNTLADYLYQFLKNGKYVSSISSTKSVDLVNLAICKIIGDQYVSDEWLSFYGVMNFVERNELHDIYLQVFSNSLASLPASAQGFVMERSFVLLLHLMQTKNQCLMDFVPLFLRDHLEQPVQNWLTSSKIVSYPVCKLTSMNNGTNLENFVNRQQQSRQEMYEFANVSAPDFLFSAPVNSVDSYWFAVGMKYSTETVDTTSQTKNERVVQLENMFFSAAQEQKHPTRQETYPCYLRKIGSINKQLELEQQPSKKKKLEHIAYQLHKLDTLVHKQKYQFRLRIEHGSNEGIATVKCLQQGYIVELVLPICDYLKLWSAFPSCDKQLRAYLEIHKSMQ